MGGVSVIRAGPRDSPRFDGAPGAGRPDSAAPDGAANDFDTKPADRPAHIACWESL